MVGEKIKTIISSVDISLIGNTFQLMDFNITLDQGLIMQLEKQARWLINYGYTDKETVPNYLNYIYTEALESVKPDSVTIISR